MSETLAVAITIAELIIWGITYWFVISWVGASPNAVLIVRILIVVITLVASLRIVLGGTPPPLRPIIGVGPNPPSIIAPERR